MEIALFLNGIFEEIFEEILESQSKNPNETFYLQPYTELPIKELQKDPPTKDNPLMLYIATTNQLNKINYVAEIIGWQDKTELSEERLADLNKHMARFQPNEGEIYPEANGKKCKNLIAIRNLKKLTNPPSTSKLIKIRDGKPLKKRMRPGGWSYVFPIPLSELE